MNNALKWKLILGFVLVFLAGGLTGAFVAAATARNYFSAASHHAVAAQRMRERLKNELNLTPEQMQKISPLIEKAAAQLEDIRKDTAHRVRQTFSDLHQQIAADVTPEQKTKLEQMRERHHHMMGRFHRGHRGSSPPGSSSP
jgi:Spy/CpxP family protein refolding chaperone